VCEFDFRLTFQIRDRSRHLQHPGVSSRREAKCAHRPFQKMGASIVVSAVLAHLTSTHLRIAVDRRSFEALAL
jgi:hypothetical protein